MASLSDRLQETNLQMARMTQLLSTYAALNDRVDKCEKEILVIRTKNGEQDGFKSHLRDWGSWVVAATALLTALWRKHLGG